MLKIYGLHTPQFFKTIWTAEELGLNYQHVPVDLTKQETRTPEHKARHPFGKVPVIEHDGRFLFESCAIIRYMASVKPTNLYPQEVFARAQVDQWTDYVSFQVGKWISTVWYEKNFAEKFFNRAPDEKIINENKALIDTDMPIIEAHLAKNAFWGGKDFTIADINAFSLMASHKEAGLDFSKYTAFTKWFETMKNRSAFKKLKDLCMVKSL